jgi:hypothetical protein
MILELINLEAVIQLSFQSIFLLKTWPVLCNNFIRKEVSTDLTGVYSPLLRKHVHDFDFVAKYVFKYFNPTVELWKPR